MSIDIVFNSNATDTAKDVEILENSINKIEQASTSSAEAIANFTKTLSGLASYGLALATGGKFAHMLDSFTQLENKIASVTGRTEKFIQVQKQLFSVASQTRSSVGEMAALFNSVSKALGSTASDSAKTIKFVKSWQQSLAISGADANAARNATIQLAQALGSGVLRGDELNSIMEQNAEAARVLSKSLGISVGQLRSMGAEGKITSKAVFKAFIDGAEDLNKSFSSAKVTISQAMASLDNSMLKAVGRIDKMTNASSKIAKIILGISKSIDNVVDRDFTDIQEGFVDTLYRIRQTHKELFQLFEGMYAQWAPFKAYFPQMVKLVGQAAGEIFKIFGELGLQLIKAIPIPAIVAPMRARLREFARFLDTEFLGSAISTFKKFTGIDLSPWVSKTEGAIYRLTRLSPKYWAASGWDIKTIQKVLSIDNLKLYVEELKNLRESIQGNSNSRRAQIKDWILDIDFAIRKFQRSYFSFSNNPFVFRRNNFEPLLKSLAELKRGLTLDFIPIQDVRRGLKAWFGSYTNMFKDAVSDLFSFKIFKKKSPLETMFDSFRNVNFLPSFKKILGAYVDAASDFTDALINAFTPHKKSFAEKIFDALKTAFSGLGSFLARMASSISKFFSNFANIAFSIDFSWIGRIFSVIKSAIDSATKSVKNLYSTVKELVSSGFGAFKDVASTVKNTVSKEFDKIANSKLFEKLAPKGKAKPISLPFSGLNFKKSDSSYKSFTEGFKSLFKDMGRTNGSALKDLFSDIKAASILPKGNLFDKIHDLTKDVHPLGAIVRRVVAISSAIGQTADLIKYRKTAFGGGSFVNSGEWSLSNTFKRKYSDAMWHSSDGEYAVLPKIVGALKGLSNNFNFSWVKSLAESLKEATTHLSNLVANFEGLNKYNTNKKVSFNITSNVASLYRKLKQVGSFIKDTLIRAFSSLSSVAKSALSGSNYTRTEGVFSSLSTTVEKLKSSISSLNGISLAGMTSKFSEFAANMSESMEKVEIFKKVTEGAKNTASAITSKVRSAIRSFNASGNNVEERLAVTADRVYDQEDDQKTAKDSAFVDKAKDISTAISKVFEDLPNILGPKLYKIASLVVGAFVSYMLVTGKDKLAKLSIGTTLLTAGLGEMGHKFESGTLRDVIMRMSHWTGTFFETYVKYAGQAFGRVVGYAGEMFKGITDQMPEFIKSPLNFIRGANDTLGLGNSFTIATLLGLHSMLSENLQNSMAAQLGPGFSMLVGMKNIAGNISRVSGVQQEIAEYTDIIRGKYVDNQGNPIDKYGNKLSVAEADKRRKEAFAKREEAQGKLSSSPLLNIAGWMGSTRMLSLAGIAALETTPIEDALQINPITKQLLEVGLGASVMLGDDLFPIVGSELDSLISSGIGRFASGRAFNLMSSLDPKDQANRQHWTNIADIATNSDEGFGKKMLAIGAEIAPIFWTSFGAPAADMLKKIFLGNNAQSTIDSFKQYMKDSFSEGKLLFTGLGNTFWTAIKDAYGSFKGWFSGIWSIYGTGANSSNGSGSGRPSFTEKLANSGGIIGALFGTNDAPGILGKSISESLKKLGLGLTSFFTKFSDALDKAGEKARQAFGNISDTVMKGINTAAFKFAAGFLSIFSVIRDIFAKDRTGDQVTNERGDVIYDKDQTAELVSNIEAANNPFSGSMMGTLAKTFGIFAAAAALFYMGSRKFTEAITQQQARAKARELYDTEGGDWEEIIQEQGKQAQIRAESMRTKIAALAMGSAGAFLGDRIAASAFGEDSNARYIGDAVGGIGAAAFATSKWGKIASRAIFSPAGAMAAGAVAGATALGAGLYGAFAPKEKNETWWSKSKEFLGYLGDLVMFRKPRKTDARTGLSEEQAYYLESRGINTNYDLRESHPELMTSEARENLDNLIKEQADLANQMAKEERETGKVSAITRLKLDQQGNKIARLTNTSAAKSLIEDRNAVSDFLDQNLTYGTKPSTKEWFLKNDGKLIGGDIDFSSNLIEALGETPINPSEQIDFSDKAGQNFVQNFKRVHAADTLARYLRGSGRTEISEEEAKEISDNLFLSIRSEALSKGQSNINQSMTYFERKAFEIQDARERYKNALRIDDLNGFEVMVGYDKYDITDKENARRMDVALNKRAFDDNELKHLGFTGEEIVTLKNINPDRELSKEENDVITKLQRSTKTAQDKAVMGLSAKQYMAIAANKVDNRPLAALRSITDALRDLPEDALENYGWAAIRQRTRNSAFNDLRREQIALGAKSIGEYIKNGYTMSHLYNYHTTDEAFEISPEEYKARNDAAKRLLEESIKEYRDSLENLAIQTFAKNKTDIEAGLQKAGVKIDLSNTYLTPMNLRSRNMTTEEAGSVGATNDYRNSQRITAYKQYDTAYDDALKGYKDALNNGTEIEVIREFNNKIKAREDLIANNGVMGRFKALADYSNDIESAMKDVADTDMQNVLKINNELIGIETERLKIAGETANAYRDQYNAARQANEAFKGASFNEDTFANFSDTDAKVVSDIFNDLRQARLTAKYDKRKTTFDKRVEQSIEEWDPTGEMGMIMGSMSSAYNTLFDNFKESNQEAQLDILNKNKKAAEAVFAGAKSSGQEFAVGKSFASGLGLNYDNAVKKFGVQGTLEKEKEAFALKTQIDDDQIRGNAEAAAQHTLELTKLIELLNEKFYTLGEEAKQIMSGMPNFGAISLINSKNFPKLVRINKELREVNKQLEQSNDPKQTKKLAEQALNLQKAAEHIKKAYEGRDAASALSNVSSITGVNTGAMSRVSPRDMARAVELDRREKQLQEAMKYAPADKLASFVPELQAIEDAKEDLKTKYQQSAKDAYDQLLGMSNVKYIGTLPDGVSQTYQALMKQKAEIERQASKANADELPRFTSLLDEANKNLNEFKDSLSLANAASKISANLGYSIDPLALAAMSPDQSLELLEQANAISETADKLQLSLVGSFVENTDKVKDAIDSTAKETETTLENTGKKIEEIDTAIRDTSRGILDKLDKGIDVTVTNMPDNFGSNSSNDSTYTPEAGSVTMRIDNTDNAQGVAFAKAIEWNESRNQAATKGEVTHLNNTNGTIDLGPFQINSLSNGALWKQGAKEAGLKYERDKMYHDYEYASNVGYGYIASLANLHPNWLPKQLFRLYMGKGFGEAAVNKRMQKFIELGGDPNKPIGRMNPILKATYSKGTMTGGTSVSPSVLKSKNFLPFDPVEAANFKGYDRNAYWLLGNQWHENNLGRFGKTANGNEVIQDSFDRYLDIVNHLPGLDLSNKNVARALKLGGYENANQKVTSAQIKVFKDFLYNFYRDPDYIGSQASANEYYMQNSGIMGLNHLTADNFMRWMVNSAMDERTLRALTPSEDSHGIIKASKNIKAGKYNTKLIQDSTKNKANEVGARIKAAGYERIISPIDNPVYTSPAGIRAHPLSGERKPHKGTDISAAEGTPVKAFASGVVTAIKALDAKAGTKRIDIALANGAKSQYLHVKDPTVKAGDYVAQGSRIASVGSRDKFSTGTHLHAAYWDKDGNLIDMSKAVGKKIERAVSDSVAKVSATQQKELTFEELEKNYDKYVNTPPPLMDAEASDKFAKALIYKNTGKPNLVKALQATNSYSGIELRKMSYNGLESLARVAGELQNIKLQEEHGDITSDVADRLRRTATYDSMRSMNLASDRAQILNALIKDQGDRIDIKALNAPFRQYARDNLKHMTDEFNANLDKINSERTAELKANEGAEQKIIDAINRKYDRRVKLEERRLKGEEKSLSHLTEKFIEQAKRSAEDVNNAGKDSLKTALKNMVNGKEKISLKNLVKNTFTAIGERTIDVSVDRFVDSLWGENSLGIDALITNGIGGLQDVFHAIATGDFNAFRDLSLLPEVNSTGLLPSISNSIRGLLGFDNEDNVVAEGAKSITDSLTKSVEESMPTDLLANPTESTVLAATDALGNPIAPITNPLKGLNQPSTVLSDDITQPNDAMNALINQAVNSNEIVKDGTSNVFDTIVQFGESLKQEGGTLNAIIGSIISLVGKGLNGLFGQQTIGSDFSSSTGFWGSIGGLGMSALSFFGFSDGGNVSGPGTSTSDSIPAMLSNGEFVVNAQATSRNLALLKAINSNRFAKGGLVGFYTGGGVDSRKMRRQQNSSVVGQMGNRLTQYSMLFGRKNPAESITPTSSEVGAISDTVINNSASTVLNPISMDLGADIGANTMVSNALSSTATVVPSIIDTPASIGTLGSAGEALSVAPSTGMIGAGASANAGASAGGMSFMPWIGLGMMALSLFMKANGGYISGPGTSTSDSIPAMLSNGEFVINAAATRRNRALLESINSGANVGSMSDSIGDAVAEATSEAVSPAAFADGGYVGNEGLGYMPTSATNDAIEKDMANNTNNSNMSQFNINITGDISRQTRQEIYAMMPNIAQGVNRHNHEKGLK